MCLYVKKGSQYAQNKFRGGVWGVLGGSIAPPQNWGSRGSIAPPVRGPGGEGPAEKIYPLHYNQNIINTHPI
ncbi:MAG: hypothetical protein EZS28_023196 [Streblomastix strix]|uniref:Uncharacterized protein n=1 Tax=Streblomastix strix TaxID=222440 RepID=A0A5J4VFS2_9EUKA|nr:MAG: hypothetical protein EZS28_023196 [Streblomastix strix]